MKGSPLHKDKAGMVDYGTEMLCIMGGYGFRFYWPAHVLQKRSSFCQDPRPGNYGWNNELHLFHIRSSKSRAAHA